ncbi:MAG: NAD(P)H-dependent oxidoreductase subunit E [bacterium]
MNEKKTIGSVLVIGGGIGGMQSALDLAESGFKVYLLDSSSAIGGTMAALDKTFPTNDCAMCIMAPKLVECGRHLNIEIITWSDVESIRGEPGNFSVKLVNRPRYVDIDKCTGCGQCVAQCPVRNRPHFEQEHFPEPMLEEKDREKVTQILEAYKEQEGALVPILQEINDAYYYLPEDLLKFVAIRLDIPLSHVYNIATFYNAFSLTPRGKYTIQVCLGTACHVKGSSRTHYALERELGIKTGETTQDKLFSLEAVRCLGCCGLAPVMTVGEDVYGGVTQTKISGILKKYRREVEVEYAEVEARRSGKDR